MGEIKSGSLSVVLYETTEEVQEKIIVLKESFDSLKSMTCEYLKRQKVRVKKVAGALTSLSPDDDDRHFFFMETHITILYRAAEIPELFGSLNLHWSYLDPSLLNHLIRELKLVELNRPAMSYESDLTEFRMKTPLGLYCCATKRKRVRLSPDFQEIVAEFDWSHPTTTLDHVEQFRQEYASNYGLHKFAMMLAQVRPGSYIITWFIPESIVEKLMKNLPIAIFKKHFINKLEIAGKCVYAANELHEVKII